MDKRLVSQVSAVAFGSLLSFASPAAATYVGAEAAGTVGGVVGWVVSALFVLAVIFPALGNYVDKLGSEAMES